MTLWPESLIRNRGALKDEEQQRLINAHVAVCGCGGLGGQVIESLARIGIGHLTIIDPDNFSPSNLNRQLGALRETMGKSKTDILAARIRQIHPHCKVNAYAEDFRTTEPLADTEVVVDCLDSVDARLELAAVCAGKNIAMVHGAVNGWYGQVGVQLPGKDLLAKLYGKRAKTPSPPPVLSFTPALVASLQAAETVKLLLGIPSRLSRGWLNIDLRYGDFDFCEFIEQE